MSAGQKLHGGLNNYYLASVPFPQREEQPAYVAECEDIIDALDLTPNEANIFKEIWRSANARKGNGKPGHRALYGAEKILHYAGRNLRRVKRDAEAEESTRSSFTNSTLTTISRHRCEAEESARGSFITTKIAAETDLSC